MSYFGGFDPADVFRQYMERQQQNQAQPQPQPVQQGYRGISGSGLSAGNDIQGSYQNQQQASPIDRSSPYGSLFGGGSRPGPTFRGISESGVNPQNTMQGSYAQPQGGPSYSGISGSGFNPKNTMQGSAAQPSPFGQGFGQGGGGGSYGGISAYGGAQNQWASAQGQKRYPQGLAVMQQMQKGWR